jgi:hypothetical protein
MDRKDFFGNNWGPISSIVYGNPVRGKIRDSGEMKQAGDAAFEQDSLSGFANRAEAGPACTDGDSDLMLSSFRETTAGIVKHNGMRA